MYVLEKNRTLLFYDFTANIIPSVFGPQWLDTVQPASVTSISEKIPRLRISSLASTTTAVSYTHLTLPTNREV